MKQLHRQRAGDAKGVQDPDSLRPPLVSCAVRIWFSTSKKYRHILVKWSTAKMPQNLQINRIQFVIIRIVWFKTSYACFSWISNWAELHLRPVRQKRCEWKCRRQGPEQNRIEKKKEAYQYPVTIWRQSSTRRKYGRQRTPPSTERSSNKNSYHARTHNQYDGHISINATDEKTTYNLSSF